MTETVLSLGSNIGNRRENLVSALVGLSDFSHIVGVSKIYETPPVGYLDQRNFLNAAIFAETDVPPMELLKLCKSLEKRIGRIPTFKNGPRTIDIDIVFYGGEAISFDELEIPHPRWRERDFVITPLMDLLDFGFFSSDRFAGVASVLSRCSRMYAPFSYF